MLSGLSSTNLVFALSLSVVLGNLSPKFALSDQFKPEDPVELGQPIVTVEVPAGTSLTEMLERIKEKIEMEGEAVGHTPETWLGRRVHATLDKFNFRHRVRVGIRETNSAPPGTVVSVPFSVVAANTAGALIGIHILESIAIGPAMIGVGKMVGGNLGVFLKGYGGLLTWPIPTGTPIDCATETFCILVGAIVAVPAIQRGVYRVELALGWAAGAAARKINLDHLYRKVFRTETGIEKLNLLLENETPYRKRVPQAPSSISIEDPDLGKLAELRFEPLESGDVRLASFSLSPVVGVSAAREILSRELAPFGWNVRDAVLKPEMLLRGGHGSRVGPDRIGTHYEITANAILLKRSYFKFARNSKAKCPARIVAEGENSSLEGP